MTRYYPRLGDKVTVKEYQCVSIETTGLITDYMEPGQIATVKDTNSRGIWNNKKYVYVVRDNGMRLYLKANELVLVER